MTPAPVQSKPRMVCERATPDDDEGIRALLREESMEGDIALRMTTEPSFFDSLRVHGRRTDVAVLREPGCDGVLGVGLRAEKPCYINGQPMSVGYLGALRIAKRRQGQRGLFQGFKRMREWHDGGNARLYLTTIMSGNTTAERALLGGRCGLPTYNDIGALRAYTIAAKAVASIPIEARLFVEPATEDDVPELVDFLNREGKRRQFFPVYEERDLHDDGMLPGLRLSDIYIARSGGHMHGVMASWRQEAFRQVSVAGYSWPRRIARPVYNLFAGLTRRAKLPAGGADIHVRKLALVCIEDDRILAFLKLLQRVMRDALKESPDAVVSIGLHERDPFIRGLARIPRHRTDSRLCVCHWEDGLAAYETLDGRPPYIELGSL